jgi:hypothetical protein
MQKTYRFECRCTTGAKTVVGYHLVSADDEQKARAEFHERQNALTKFPDSPSIEILAVDEIDDATIRASLEGADLSTIPALQRLPQNSLLITPADDPGCESGWIRRVFRDAEGHDLADSLKVVGCRGYMESPPQGGPWYLVSSSDGTIGVLLCQEHLTENFPRAVGAMRVGSRVSRHKKVIHG